MPNVIPFVKKNLRIYKDAITENKAIKSDPEYFQPYSIQTFYGEQGSGKTTALIHFYKRIAKRYPKAIVVSNIILKDRQALTFQGSRQTLLSILSNPIDTSISYIYYTSKEEYALVNQHVRNGKYGVILITDEYQNYFSNQDSRNVPPWVIEQAAQTRKQRRVHLVTSQDYDQIAKPIRRRSDTAFKCRTYSLPLGLSHGPILTVYWAYDAKKLDFDGNGRQNAVRPLKVGFFFHSAELRASFDTHQVVFTGDESDGVYRSSHPTVTIAARSTSPPKSQRRFRLTRS